MKRHYLFMDQPLEQLQAEIQGSKKPMFKRLYELSRLYAEERLPDEHPDKSTTFMGMAAFNLSLNYVLTDQEQYLKEAKRWIFTAVGYPHWGNVFLVDVDLSAAWMLFGLSISYDWLKDSLTEEERTTLKNKIILQAERMYKFKVETEGEGWSTSYWQNHNWINLTGLATAGYALRDEYADAQLWIDDAKANFEKVYDYLADDGSNYEGVVYWRYGVVWLYTYAHLLKTEEGIDYFPKSDFLKNTFYYRLYQAVPNLEETANFGDCHDKRSGHSVATYYKIAAEYNNGHAQYLGNKVKDEFLFREQYESKVKPGVLPEAGLELLWYDPTVKEENFEQLPLVKKFDDLGLVVVRSSWEEDAIHFSFKSGAPGGKKQWEESAKLLEKYGIKTRGLSHQHPDNNSFIIHGFDTYLAIDEGYNRTLKALEHNVITVDGLGYRDEGQNNIWHNVPQDKTAEITNFISEDGITYFAGEAHKMYVDELELTKYKRHVIYSGAEHFIIIDELDSEKEHTYTFNLHTETKPELLEEGVFDYKNGPGAMRMYSSISSDNEMNHKTGNTYVKAIMTSQEPDIYRDINMDTLYLENNQRTKELSFVNVLSIRDAFSDERLTVTKLKEETSYGYTIGKDQGREVVLYSEEGHISYENIEAIAKVLYVNYGADNKMNVLAVDCSHLFVDGKVHHEGKIQDIMIGVEI